MIAFALIMAAAAQPATAAKPRIIFQEPPKAAEVTGPIEAVMLAPLYRQPFFCSEHYDGQMPYAGDALGTDCLVLGGIAEDGSGFSALYRTDGKRNEDWFGWGADVLSPVDGVVVGLFPNERVNAPGTQGRPPAGMLQLRRDDGTIVMLGHVAGIRVKAGQRVKAGEPIAVVGNNGPSRAPHIHIGAYRGNVPLQIRWDQKAMAALQAEPSKDR